MAISAESEVFHKSLYWKNPFDSSVAHDVADSTYRSNMIVAM
jgi:hypothetical protein